MNEYQQKRYAIEMEPVFKKMQIGDRGIFDREGKEFFVAKHMTRLSVGAYRDRKYILPIEFLNDIPGGLKKEAGYQITAGYFGKHFTYMAPERAPEMEEHEKPSLVERVSSAQDRTEKPSRSAMKKPAKDDPERV